MERRGISVRQIADALDVTTQTVYGWQSGKTVINEERVPRLAAALEISEMDARRGLGFWVPDERVRDDPDRGDEIDAALDVMRAAMAELERIKRDRRTA
jgi:transcriptional regulator with XRE-family HTH domain